MNMDAIDRAIQLMDNGKVDEAHDLLKKTASTATDDEKFMIADLYYEWGFFDDAVILLEQLLDIYPNEGQIITKLAEMYIELEKDEPAIDILNGIDERDSFYLPSLLQLADLYQAQGLFEVSEQKLLEAKQLAPEEEVIDFALGELLFSIGQYNRAIPFYEKASARTNEINHISIEERLAECHALIGHYELALEYYSKTASKNPDTLFKYGFTAFQHNKHEIAIQIWKQLIELDPHYHSVYPELAQALKEEGLIEDAYDIAEKGLSYDEFNKELYLLAGQLATALKKRTEAIEYVKQAVSLDADYKEAIIMLIQLYKDDHLHSDIIDLIENIKRLGANDPLYEWELARAHYEEEHYKDAAKAYEEASIHLAHDKDFLKEYGYFLTEEGQLEKAISILETYISLEPFDEETASFLERLKFSIHD